MHLVLVDFEYVDVFQASRLLFPITGQHLGVFDTPQKTLHIERDDAFGGKVANEIGVKIVGEKAAEMKNVGVHVAKVLHFERIGLGQDTLCAMVRVLSVGIFENHRGTARDEFHFRTDRPEFVDDFVVVFADRRDQTKCRVRETGNAVRKIIGRSSTQVIGVSRCDDFVVGDVPDAADFFHARTSCRNSSRNSGRSNSPQCAVVTVSEHCFSTPRICMHMWCASTITITPRGLRASRMASRIW